AGAVPSLWGTPALRRVRAYNRLAPAAGWMPHRRGARRGRRDVSMHRLAPRDAYRAAPVFAALEQHLAVPSALAGETPADLFVDDVAHPQVGLPLPTNRHPPYPAGGATPRVCIAVAQLLHQ